MTHTLAPDNPEFRAAETALQGAGIALVAFDEDEFDTQSTVRLDTPYLSLEERDLTVSFDHFLAYVECPSIVTVGPNEQGWSVVPATIIWVSDCDFSDL